MLNTARIIYANTNDSPAILHLTTARSDLLGNDRLDASESCDNGAGCTHGRLDPGFRCPDRGALACPTPCDAGLAWTPPPFLAGAETAPPGLYCASTCIAFPTPPGAHMTPPPDCRLVNTNECPADCDAHATCIDLDPLAPGAVRNLTHECVCDDAVFPVDAHGRQCSTSGLELDFAVNATAAVLSWPRSRAPHDVLACLVAGGFATAAAPGAGDAAVAIGLDYSVRVRLAMSFVRLDAPWASLGTALDACLPVNLTRRDVCEREPTRACDGQCAPCRADWPAAFVTVVENALDAPVLEVASFGYVLASLSFRGLRWRVEVRFDRNFFGDGLPFVFLTQKSTVLNASPVPCALGARNDNGTCCVADLPARFRIPARLAADIAELRAAHGGGCPAAAWRNWSTANATRYLDGAWAGLSTHSTASVHPLRPDTVAVVLTYDDVVQFVGSVNYADDAEHVQFALGLGLLRLSSDVVQVSAPPAHIYSKITNQYYFTSQV